MVSMAIFLMRPFVPPAPPDRRRSEAPSGREITDWFSRFLGPKMFRERLLATFAKRSLPFSSDDIELVCALAGHGTDPEAFRFVASVVRRHFTAHPGDRTVVSAVETLLARAGQTVARRSRSFFALQIAVSSQNVLDGADNALLDDGDHFASPARDSIARLSTSWPGAWRVVVISARPEGAVRPRFGWQGAKRLLGLPHFRTSSNSCWSW